MAATGSEEERTGGAALGAGLCHLGVARRRGRTLLVRHLPAELTVAEKEDLLQHFGAVAVRVLSDHGRLKHTAFATFPSENAAVKALSRLHQLKLLGHTLVVEFAKEQDSMQVLNQPSFSDKYKSSEEPVKEEKRETSCLKIENGIAPSHGLTFPINSCLKYLYPPPSSTILANIANALASVPKFYVQVLHLMNKMNLPPPFGPITTRPPMYEEYLPVPVPPPPIPPLPPEEPPLPEEEEEQISSGDESEYESDNEEEKERMTKLMELATLQPKRPINTKKRGVRKKQRIKDLLNVPTCTPHSNLHPTLSPSDVFEQPQYVGLKKIEFHITTDIPSVLQINLEREEKNDLYATTEEINHTGFGRIFPTPSSNDKMETEEEDDEIPSEFISRRELEKNRLSREEMEKFSVFKNYEPGEPNCRIYVKNLAKQVQEKDLKFIFGRYVDFQSVLERNMFDIRLMKEGRMKGQAFIGLPNEKAAAKALKEANGYVLFEKPMVVQFARSARPKQDSNEVKRKK
ncbi:RNA-binding region-containing protein 3 [Gallus gallus]|nr:RNA-binding region-containing protein 3 [Gallus gallus]XP_015146290.3 RNA-binding region-containing protein 3 [Gallus gallus]XP_025008808.2 RNA-binding region-containing protein 3 [Gallus gallus]XP_040533581.1 RNA-binding region-containing protein 3 [Gallus gallus]XP_040533582.1 RNA-binding region-containing protein 3 [Gallus gallus]XP_040533583.1 RNA-binding region-containing protein 3 [Gallus gallus]XP_040533584.1 RNA-binding region-containing protein 3 [Gallus gallus]XP_040560863.1 RNA